MNNTNPSNSGSNSSATSSFKNGAIDHSPEILKSLRTSVLRTFRPADVRPPELDLESAIARLSLCPEAETYVRAAAVAPSRVLRSSRSRHVYAPIPKYSHSVAQESHTLEYAGVLLAAYHPGTLEIFEQPPQVFGKVVSAAGKVIPVSYTPDLLVVGHQGIEILEFKYHSDLEAYIAKRNAKYSLIEGEIRNVWADNYFSKLGFKFRLVTEHNICPRFYEAARILHPYTSGHENQTPISTEEQHAVVRWVELNPGTQVKHLPIQEIGRRAEVAMFMIARAILYTSWSENDFKYPDSIRLFATPVDEIAFAKYEAHNRPFISDPTELASKLKVGCYVEFGGTQYSVTKFDRYEVRLSSADGTLQTLPISVLAQQSPRVGSSISAELSFESRFRALTLEQRASFIERKNRVSQHLPGGAMAAVTPKTRKERDWLRKYKASVAAGLPGDAALLPNYSASGRKKALMAPEVEKEYARLVATKRMAETNVSGEWIWQCLCGKFGPENLISKRSLYRRVESLNKYEESLAVAGVRLASKHEPFFGDNAILGPSRGNRSWQNAHIDSTPLDLEIDGNTRQWLTLLVDSYDNRILAAVLSGERVNGETIRTLLIHCVDRYGFLPQSITCDRGSEHRTRWMTEVLLQINVTIIFRRTASGRDGSPVESTFSAMCRTLIHNLEGNTKLRKNVRLLTKAYDPANRKVWNVAELADLIDEYLELRNDTPKGSIPSPNSLCQSCETHYGPPPKQLSSREAFRIMFLPRVKGLPKVSDRGLIRCLNRVYGFKGTLNPLMAYRGKHVLVRFDHDDLSVIFVYLTDRSGCIELSEITPAARISMITDFADELDRSKEEALRAQALPATPEERKAEFVVATEEKQIVLATAKEEKKRRAFSSPQIRGIMPNPNEISPSLDL